MQTKNSNHSILKMLIDKKRPILLSWLCIGSALSGIMWIIMMLVLILYSLSGNVPSSLFPGIVMEYYQEGYYFFVALIVLAGIGLVGVYMMWKMKIAGFYTYAVIKVVQYFLPVVFLGYNHLTFIGLAITSILIILYGVSITNPANMIKS